MGYNFLPYDQEQMYLVPPSVKEWVPEGSLARFVCEVVDGMDQEGRLCQFYQKYRADGWGSAAYHPLMMVKVLLYGYCLGLTSSRKLAQALENDISFRYLAANQQPDFRTISDFRKDNLKALEGHAVVHLPHHRVGLRGDDAAAVTAVVFVGGVGPDGADAAQPHEAPPPERELVYLPRLDRPPLLLAVLEKTHHRQETAAASQQGLVVRLVQRFGPGVETGVLRPEFLLPVVDELPVHGPQPESAPFIHVDNQDIIERRQGAFIRGKLRFSTLQHRHRHAGRFLEFFQYPDAAWLLKTAAHNPISTK